MYGVKIQEKGSKISLLFMFQYSEDKIIQANTIFNSSENNNEKCDDNKFQRVQKGVYKPRGRYIHLLDLWLIIYNYSEF